MVAASLRVKHVAFRSQLFVHCAYTRRGFDCIEPFGSWLLIISAPFFCQVQGSFRAGTEVADKSIVV